MKWYVLVFLCSIAQLYGMEESVKYWSDNPAVRNGFENFLGKINFYTTKSLMGGLSNEAPVICTVNDKKYVARMFKGLPDDRHNRAHINKLAADKGLAPKVHYHGHCDDTFDFMIMDFVDASTLSLEQANNPKVIDLIAKKVKLIAQFDKNIVTHNKENCFDETIRHYHSVKKKNCDNFDAVLEEVKNKTELIHQEIDKHKRPLVIGHNDFHPRNIFFKNNDIVIIDWDTLALNYEFGDLTAYSIFSCLSHKNDIRLLRKYLGCIPTDEDKHYFKTVKLLSRACLVLSFFEFVDCIPESVSVESIKNFKHYATCFAQGTDFDVPDFFYECGMSQLQ
ncbi:MAG TPA: phosphotransferase, partial [Candidatus Babeliales bacterium]|jgi:thiamine kinase-like enzyme|nr:phosphotransferase [Candidatus Babeliales bacterium]